MDVWVGIYGPEAVFQLAQGGRRVKSPKEPADLRQNWRAPAPSMRESPHI